MIRPELKQAAVNLYRFLKSLGKAWWRFGQPPVLNTVIRKVFRKAMQGRSAYYVNWHTHDGQLTFSYHGLHHYGLCHIQRSSLSPKDLQTAFDILNPKLIEFSVSLFPHESPVYPIT